MIIYLYKKTHKKTGLKYLGKTIRDPFKYKGSGLYWKNHLKIHGNDITTEIVGTYETEDQAEKAGLYYSKLWNIVKSDKWANLIPEAGKSVYKEGYRPSEATKQKMSLAAKGKVRLPLSKEHKQKISNSLKGINTWMKGKSLSEETKIKMAEAHKGMNKPWATHNKNRDSQGRFV